MNCLKLIFHFLKKQKKTEELGELEDGDDKKKRFRRTA